MTEITEQGRANLASLEPLFKRADAERLWFRTSYQQLSFSPQELRAAHANGRMIWGAENWELISPDELVASAERNVRFAVRALEMLRERMRRSRA